MSSISEQPEPLPSAALTRLQVDQTQRLGALALVVALVVLAGSVLQQFGIKAFGWVPAPGYDRSAVLPLLLLSVAVFLLSRWGTVPFRSKMWVGRGYQLLGAALVAWPMAWGPPDRVLVEPGLFSWLAVWILMFPLVVPSRPVSTLALALLSATLAPLIFCVHALHGGHELPDWRLLYRTFHPYYVCALLAVAPGYVLHRLRARLRRAREEVRRLGSYRMIRQLGEGGMGEVWLAEHELLTRSAAVKVIKADRLLSQDPLEREGALARFEEEARTTSSLRCPHTVSLYDYGVAQDGSFYYAMELLTGVDLETYVYDHGAMEPARIVYLMHQACMSLAEAHAEGFVHRDVKPANLFLCKLGLQYDFLKVLDFGLVGRRKVPQQSPKITERGYIVGTPAYMSPEQGLGEEEVDGRADLYSLGCVAYWLLTTRTVFKAPSGVPMLVAHINDPPAPPSACGVDVPQELEDVIMACLEKDRENRPRSALALANRLERLSLHGQWDQKQARSWWEEQDVSLATGSEDAARESTRLMPAKLFGGLTLRAGDAEVQDS